MNLQEQVKEKLIAALKEDVYKVEHEGHPDADKVKELSHLKPGKKYTNHITKYPESAKKAAAMLKKNGFQGVKIYKNWQVMEGVELEEENHTHEVHFYRESDPQQNTAKMKVTAKSDMDARTKVHQAQGEYGSVKIRKVVKLGEDVELDEAFNAEKKWPHGGSVMVGVNPRASKLPRYTVLFDPNKDPKRLTRGGLKTREISHHEDEGEAKNAADAYATKFGYQRMKPMGESIELEEGKMSEIHSDIGQHMDKHIGEYKRAGGAERLMHHAAKATPKIAKLHGIEHKHAEKFVSDYIDSRLSEETLDEGRGSKVTAFKMLVNKFKKPKADTSDEMDDVYAKAKAHVAKKHPGYNLASLGRGENGSINYEVLHPKTGVSKEGVIKEETLDEAYSVKQYSGAPKSVAKDLSLANKSNGSKVRGDGTLEFHEKDGNQVHVHNVWSEDGGKTSKYTVKTYSNSLYKKNYGKTVLESVELDEGVSPKLRGDVETELFKSHLNADEISDYHIEHRKDKSSHKIKVQYNKARARGMGPTQTKHFNVVNNKGNISLVKEETLDEESKVKVGDSVHVGLAQKGGTGFEGVATHIDYANNQIHFRSKEKGKYGYRTFRGQLSNATVK